MDCDLLEFVDEFVWILEDIVDFIVGCVVVVMICYCQQLLLLLFSVLMKYSDIYEYFWVVSGYQGGVGFIKIFVGCFYYDYYGENLFCIDMGIE